MTSCAPPCSTPSRQWPYHQWPGLCSVHASHSSSAACSVCAPRYVCVQIYAFDTSASPGKHTTKGLATYSSAACRTFLDLHLVSVPSNVTLNSSQLYLPPAGIDPAALTYKRNKLARTLVPYVVGGSILLIGVIAACMCIARWFQPRQKRPEELEFARV